MDITPSDFATAFRGFLDHMRAEAKPVANPLRDRLAALFGADPATLALLSEEHEGYDIPNVQLAMDCLLTQGGAAASAVGIVPEVYQCNDLGSSIVSPRNRADVGPPREGPMTFMFVQLDGDRVLPCARFCMYLFAGAETQHAFFVAIEDSAVKTVVKVQVMATNCEIAIARLAEFHELMRERDVYKGHILTVTSSFMHGLKIEFARMPRIHRDEVILPAGIMDRLERQTVQFSEHQASLHAGGFHLKRGLLLYGPPGTGKTLTTMYLAGAAKGRTVILLFGHQFSSMSEACAVARRLQPAVVIMEDVDMIAEDRSSSTGTSLLHDLLNAMDGLEGDADIQFILTTNRAEVLEHALRQRPGRVDLALEIPLPDAECRRRILQLFCRGVLVGLPNFDEWVARTDGASATFLRELIRRAALESLLEGGAICIEHRHLEKASNELVEVGGNLTRSLLGFGHDANSK